MVKRRQPKLTEAHIESFANQADKIGGDFLNPKAPRNYKSIAIPFNEYEFKKLNFACEKTGRSKNGLIRYLLLQCAKQLEEKETL
jgi:hypothetical protein